jgi:hypothetical protein
MTTKDSTGKQFGVNIWWTMPETSIDGIRAQTILKKHGFEITDMKLPSRQAEVSRTAYSFQNRRSKEQRRVTEKARDTGKNVVYGILDRQQEGVEVAFEQHTTVTLDKDSGAVKVDGALKTEFNKALNEFQGKITDQDLRYFLRRVIRMCWGIPKRPTGGIYFVPAKYADVIEQAQAALAELNTHARIYVERVMDGTQERENVWESVESEVEGRLSEALAAVGRIERRVDAIAGQKEKIDGAAELMKVYQQLLGEEAKFEEVAEKIEDAVKVVNDKMAALTANVVPKKPVTPRVMKNGGSTVVEAAVKVLAKIGKAMTYREIMDEAVNLGLYKATCAAPYESFISGLTKALSRGENRFRRVARGVYQTAA